jgi:hypothetical protein
MNASEPMRMTREELQEFVDRFNHAADKEAFFDRYFDPDVVFVHPCKGTFRDTDYLGPGKEGDVFWGRCADFYELTGDRISHVQLYLNLMPP